MTKTFSTGTVIVLTLSLLLLLSPSFSQAEDDDKPRNSTPVFHITDELKLISAQKIQFEKPHIVVKTVYPRLEGTDTEAFKGFNQLIDAIIKEIITEFKNKVNENRSSQENLSKNSIKNNLFIDYNAVVIKPGKDRLISIRFSIQGLIAGLHKPCHYHRVLNYNMSTEELIELTDLFQADSPYLEFLSEYSSSALNKRLVDRTRITESTGPYPQNFRNWNLKPDGLFLTFDNNQESPSVAGTQTVLIPYPRLRGIMSTESPIIQCIERPRKCASANVLTGGFIAWR